MSSGRSHVVDCGDFGNIEFIHTARQAGDLASELSYDAGCHLWRVSDSLALRDMKVTRSSLDLVQEGTMS